MPLPHLPQIRALARRLARSTLPAAALAGSVAALAASATAAPFVLAAAPDPSAQHAYVVEVTNKGDLADPDATILSVVDTALQRWVVESDHVISSFTRVGGVHPLETATDCTDLGALWDEAQQLFPDVDFGGESGNHLIVLGPAACPSGHGTVGDGLHSGGLVTVRYNPDSSPQTLLHELGHNFGLEHDHALACDPACADVTYGNEYSFMGYTLAHDPAYVPAALDSYQRQRLGIDEHCEIRQAELTNGQVAGRATYVLAPRGTDDGARGVRVVDPQTGTVYYLDFRNGAGRDSDAFYVGSGSFREGVTVEKVITDGDGDEVTQLQSTPDDHYGAVYSTVAGGTFQAGGISVHVDQLGTPDEADATATVTVTLTTAPGLDAAAQPLTDGCESEAAPSPSASASLPPVEITPTELPTTLPTQVPTAPTAAPTGLPTAVPTTVPTSVPTTVPTTGPSATSSVAPAPAIPSVNLPTALPTDLLTLMPTALPTDLLSAIPTLLPSLLPSGLPSGLPTISLPTISLPTLAVPTVAVPTVAVPTVAVPTTAVPTTSVPTASPSQQPSAPSTPPLTTPPTSTPPKHDPPDDTSNHPPTPPRHGLLPSTGSPRELLAEIAAAAFALGFGGVLVLAGRRPRARPGGRAR